MSRKIVWYIIIRLGITNEKNKVAATLEIVAMATSDMGIDTIFLKI